MTTPEVIEFRLGPRPPCRIVANPPYEVRWYEQDMIVEHTGERLTITTRGRINVKLLTKGYTRAGVQASEGTGHMWMTTGFTKDKPMYEDEIPVVGGVLNELLAGRLKDENPAPGAKFDAKINGLIADGLSIARTARPDITKESDPDELILPAPVQSIRDSIENLGCFDFWLDDDRVAKLVDANMFGKALAPMAVVLGKEADGRWRLTRA